MSGVEMSGVELSGVEMSNPQYIMIIIRYKFARCRESFSFGETRVIFATVDGIVHWDL